MLWKDAGLTYLRYSQIAAQIVRKCAKKGTQKAGATIVITEYKDGKPKKAE